METSDLLRHQKIKTLTVQHPENVADTAINLWEPMAAQIISIVGEGGFNSLYERSLFLTRSTFPWLETDIRLSQIDNRFAELKMNLEGQTPALAGEANSLLLITFTDILASLIGEAVNEHYFMLCMGR